MGRVAVVTDSTACLPKALVASFGITVVPVSLIFEDRVYRDGVDDTGALYALIETAPRIPTTSAPSPGDYLEAFQAVATEGRAVLCVTVSPQFSTMYDAARSAADLLRREDPRQQVAVVDSRNAAMAQGFVVLAAARAAAAGAELAEATASAEAVAGRSHLLFALDTLSYLVKGGRVPRAAGWASAILKVKPIVHYHAGQVGLLERPRTKPKALHRLVELMQNFALPGPTLHAGVQHAADPAAAQELAERVEAAYHPGELYISEFTPVMGVHTGPGLVGVAFYNDPQG